MNNGITVIIPTYNEKRNIILLVKELENFLQNLSYELIIVDDNSPDGTYQELITQYENDKRVVPVIRKNGRGLASAILHGINNSKYSIIIGMDADFNHPPELVPRLLKEIKNNDLVVASRFIKGGGMEDKKRYYGTLVFNNFLKYILGFPTMDNMSGFYVVRKKMLLKLPIDKIYKGYGEYHLRLVYLAKKNHFKIKEVPVFYKKRLHGKSKSNLLKMFLVYTKEALRLKLHEKSTELQNSCFRA